MQIVNKNILAIGLSRVISGAVLFFVYVSLASYLGPQDFGRFSLVVAYYLIFFLLIDLGISKYVTREVSEKKELASAYFGNFLLAQTLVSAVAFIFFLFIPRFLNYDDSVTRAMVLTGAGLLITSFSMPFLAVLHAWQKLGTVAFALFVNSMITAFWLVLTIWLEKDVVFIFWLYIIIGFFYVLIYFLAVRRIMSFRFTINLNLVKRLFWFGLPFFMISGFEILIQKLDVIIQKFFLPFSQVGLYSAAYRFLDFLTFIPAAVALSLFPYLSEKAKSLRDPEIGATLNRLNRFLVALAVPLGVGASVLGDRIILTLFQEAYAGSILPFRILIWASALSFVYAVPNVIMLVKRTNFTVVMLGLVTLFNGLGNLIFVPRFGILASAWLTVVSYLILAGIYIFFAKKEANFQLLKFLGWPFAAAAVMGYVVWLARDLNIILLIFLSVLVYFGILIMVKFFGREDWLTLKNLFSTQKD